MASGLNGLEIFARGLPESHQKREILFSIDWCRTSIREGNRQQAMLTWFRIQHLANDEGLYADAVVGEKVREGRKRSQAQRRQKAATYQQELDNVHYTNRRLSKTAAQERTARLCNCCARTIARNTKWKW